MKTTIYFLLASFLTLTACAEYDEGTTLPDDKTCEAGDECGDDKLPPPESESWVCRSGVADGRDYFECNQREYATPASVGVTAYFVGECPTEGITGYWDGRLLPDAVVDGWPRLYLEGQSGNQHCELTLAFCNRASDTNCWLQYGPAEATPEVAGDYRECGVRSGVEACGMFFIRQAGEIADSLGYYPK